MQGLLFRPARLSLFLLFHSSICVAQSCAAISIVANVFTHSPPLFVVLIRNVAQARVQAREQARARVLVQWQLHPALAASGALLLSLVWPAVWRAQRNFRPWLSAGLYLAKTARAAARGLSTLIRNPRYPRLPALACRHLICEALQCRLPATQSGRVALQRGQVALGLVCLLQQWQPVINFRARPSSTRHRQ